MSVYTGLRNLIVSGEIEVGVRLSETSLAERLDVSRTPVREALARLDGDGLVNARGRGVFVRALPERELLEVLQAREALEAFAVGQAARLVAAGEVSPARLRELTELADRTYALTRNGDLAAATTSNRAFHQATVALAGNQVIEATLDRWWDQIVVATRAGLGRADRVDQVHREHLAILDAMTAGDHRAASRAVCAHVRATRSARPRA